MVLMRNMAFALVAVCLCGCGDPHMQELRESQQKLLDDDQALIASGKVTSWDGQTILMRDKLMIEEQNDRLAESAMSVPLYDPPTLPTPTFTPVYRSTTIDMPEPMLRPQIQPYDPGYLHPVPSPSTRFVPYQSVAPLMSGISPSGTAY